MPGTDIEGLARDLVADDVGGVEQLFTALELPAPVLTWEPSEADLELRELRFLHGLWHQLRGPAPMPVAPELGPELLRPALGFIMILDVLDDGTDFRYRLFGSKIAQRAGYDATGKRSSEIGKTRRDVDFCSICYRAAYLRRRPLFTAHVPPQRGEIAVWRRLILPLAGGDGAVYRFLVGNVPGPWRPAPII